MESGAVRDEAGLLEHLRGADAPCPACGYNLRGLGGLTCPECGRRFRIEDLGREPRPAWAGLLLSGWGWWLCTAAMGATYVWEGALGERTIGWYARWFEGRNGWALIPTALMTLLLAWPLVRLRASRWGAESLLACAWVLVGVQLAALAAVSVWG